jgi:nicotinamidase-related amidase
MLMEARQSVLVLVDLQKKLMPAIHAGNDVVAQCVRLANIATLLDVPVIGTEQNPAGLGSNVEQVRQLCEQTVIKTHFGACADGLLDVLPPARRSIVVAGCEAHVCMLQTALGLLQNNYDVWIVRDAVGSRKESDRDTALERLKQGGAHLVTTEMVAFEWLRHSGHPNFRAVLNLIK